MFLYVCFHFFPHKYTHMHIHRHSDNIPIRICRWLCSIFSSCANRYSWPLTTANGYDVSCRVRLCAMPLAKKMRWSSNWGSGVTTCLLPLFVMNSSCFEILLCYTLCESHSPANPNQTKVKCTHSEIKWRWAQPNCSTWVEIAITVYFCINPDMLTCLRNPFLD